jgi:UrcA family protein
MSLTSFPRRVLVASLSLLAAASVATAAAAQEPAPSVRVPYGDLDLTAAPGARVMFERIKNAADRACGGVPDIRDLERRTSFGHCTRGAVARAVTQLHTPLVTAIYDPPRPKALASY